MRGLMNRRAPISGFDRPSRASRAIWASWAVSPSLRLDGALAGGLAGGQQLARGALGERLGAHGREHVVRGAQLLARVQPPALRGAAIRRRRDGRGRATRGRGCGRAARSPRDRGPRRPRPRSAALATWASTPSAQSVPRARVALRELPERVGGQVGPPGPGGGLDQLERPPGGEHQLLRLLAEPPGRGERVRIPAEAVVEHRGRIVAGADRPRPRRERSRPARWPRSAPCASASWPRQPARISRV